MVFSKCIAVITDLVVRLLTRKRPLHRCWSETRGAFWSYKNSSGHRVCALSHITADFCAPAASLSTQFAMVVVLGVFPTLLGAGFADVGAKLADIGCVCAATGHERDGSIADFSAVAVEPDAGRHHHNVLFAETRFGAGIAGNGASLAGFDAVLILGRC